MEQIQKLSKVQAGLLRSIKALHDATFNAEMSQAVQDIAEEIGVLDDVKAGKASLRVEPDLATVVITRPDEPTPDAAEKPAS